MSPDEARRLVGDYGFGWSYSLYGLGGGDALDPDEHDETRAELERRVAEGEAPVEMLKAFRIAAEDNRRRYERELRRFRREIAKHGALAAGNAAQDSFANGAVFDAFMDASKEDQLQNPAPGPTRVLFLNPRNRESRPRTARSRRSRASSSGSSSDDSDLADIRRRCPRCGGAVRALLPSPHWRCDPCADALWETMVERELGRVFAEADRITRGAS